METLPCIQERRSVRKYKADSVPAEALAKIIEAFRWAPSWANTQPWELIVVTDPAIKTKLADCLPAVNPSRKATANAPVVMVACGKRGVSGFYQDATTTVHGDWMMFDVGIATQNLCLAAKSLGLGTVHVGLFDHKKADAVLGLPEGTTTLEFLPLGYPDHTPNNPGRKEVSAFVHQDKFGRPWVKG